MKKGSCASPIKRSKGNMKRGKRGASHVAIEEANKANRAPIPTNLWLARELQPPISAAALRRLSVYSRLQALHHNRQLC